MAINLHKRYAWTMYVHPFVRFGINISILISAVCCCCSRSSMENGQLKTYECICIKFGIVVNTDIHCELRDKRFGELTFKSKQTNHAANISHLDSCYKICILSLQPHVLLSIDWLLWRVNILSINKFCTNSHINYVVHVASTALNRQLELKKLTQFNSIQFKSTSEIQPKYNDVFSIER